MRSAPVKGLGHEANAARWLKSSRRTFHRAPLDRILANSASRGNTRQNPWRHDMERIWSGRVWNSKTEASSPAAPVPFTLHHRALRSV